MKLSKKTFNNKKILIYGFGKSGISSYFFLKKKNHVYCYDDNKNDIKNNSIKNSILNKHHVSKIKYDYIVISPGINARKCSLKNFLKKNIKIIITDLDIFYSHYKTNKIITITGTNGKSTASQLLYEILKKHKKDARMCGNIGKPILNETRISAKTIFVIEASSYQIEYSNFFSTNYAIILNISPDHLERHGSIRNYVKSKVKLILNQSKKDFAYINIKNKYMINSIQKKKIYSQINYVDLKVITKVKKKIFNPYFLNYNNQENLSFIFAISKKLKLKNKKIFQTINNFKGLKFRQQIIYKSKKITCINDSKSTSFSSSTNTLPTFEKVLWIVGGKPKTGDKFLLKKKECKNIKAYIFGKNRNFFINQFNRKLDYSFSNNLKNIMNKVFQDMNLEKKNILHKTIFFSPAAASFDSFKNFEDRGEQFNFLFKKYKFKMY